MEANVLSLFIAFLAGMIVGAAAVAWLLVEPPRPSKRRRRGGPPDPTQPDRWLP
jgi:hypothetical protein